VDRRDRRAPHLLGLRYEHCNYFTVISPSSRSRFEPERSRAFGDQYLWLEATATTEPVDPPAEAERRALRCRRGAGAIAAARAPCSAPDDGSAAIVWGMATKGDVRAPQ
jgi:hypothetical protein